MSFSLPLFFRMRLVIVIALVLLGFFFIGLLNRAFAYDCYNYSPSDPDYTLDMYDNFCTDAEIDAACADNVLQTSCECGNFSGIGINTDGIPDGTYCCATYAGSPGNYTFNLFCQCDTVPDCNTDPCSDVSPTPSEDCLSESNITWGEGYPSSCDYTCKCPDYAGQASYNFETCEEITDADPCADQAASECGDLEFVIWEHDNADPCKYHCDQGNCEDEYLVAREQCDNPYLVDGLTCQYDCACETERGNAKNECYLGAYIDLVTCEYFCKCCEDKEFECNDYCGGADNVKPGSFFCSDDWDVVNGTCNVDTSTYTPCECIVPPVDDTDPPGNPAPDPEDDPDNDKTCADYEAECSNSCQFSCVSDSETGLATYHNCDCNDDPSDPGPDGESGTEDDGEAGSADDGANGWLKQIEENTDKTASNVETSNKWLDSIKENTDTLIENDQKYFSADGESVFKNGNGGSVFKDDSGESYLKQISEKLDNLGGVSAEGEFNLNIGDATVNAGEYTLPEDNQYSTTFTEDEGFEPLPEDTFSQSLSDYISTGIPLVSYIENSSIQLTSSSSQLSMSFWGNPVTVDFADYTSVIDLAGNILFSLTVFSSIMLIITRVKG